MELGLSLFLAACKRMPILLNKREKKCINAHCSHSSDKQHACQATSESPWSNHILARTDHARAFSQLGQLVSDKVVFAFTSSSVLKDPCMSETVNPTPSNKFAFESSKRLHRLRNSVHAGASYSAAFKGDAVWRQDSTT